MQAENIPSVNNIQLQKKGGRGITRMNSIYSRQNNQPKLKVLFNAYGQPVSRNAAPFKSFIGTLVKSKEFSLGHDDWRLVDINQKFKLWDDLKVFFAIQI